jgi:hypothetical protein
MSSNPYAPPTAELADAQAAQTQQPAFFAVSIAKLTVLSLCTLGLYELYWFYKNWQFVRARERSNIVPVLRAFFAVFFCYACFARIRDHGKKVGIQPPLSAGACATGWILTTIMWRLPDPYWLVSMAAFLFLLPAQAYANRVNAAVAPEHDRNSKFTESTWITTVIGGAFFLLAVFGTLFPEQ